jgi:shikimate dehydrogenase
MRVLTLEDLRNGLPDDLRLLVVGDPVEHSLSPAMHNAALEYLHLPHRYGRLRIAREDLGEAFQLLRDRDPVGWNVTLPHKLAAKELVDSLDPLAERVGAVNTVVNMSGRLFGYNTDCTGLVAAIAEVFGQKVTSFRIALLGAGGGAGQTAARYLCELGVPRIVLVNRTMSKAEQLAQCLRAASPRFPDPSVGSTEIEVAAWDALPSVWATVDLIINASTLGLKDEAILPGFDSIGPNHLLFDMVYSPQETPLVRFARTKGAQAADGLLMLLFQGVFAFEIWFGKPAPVEIMRQALFAAAERKG